MDGLREIKRNRIIQKVESLLNSLSCYRDIDENIPNRYYNSLFFDYIYLSHTEECIFLNRRFKDYGLGEEYLIPIIKKFTKYENYDILWDTMNI